MLAALSPCSLLFCAAHVFASGSRVLPYVVLKGSGVAIGRGKEALWAVASSSNSAGSPRSALASGSDRHLGEVLKRNLGFVEVADGRVSRLHCIISLTEGVEGALQATLEDCSSNGTFLDGKQLTKGESGEQCTLVISSYIMIDRRHCDDTVTDIAAASACCPALSFQRSCKLSISTSTSTRKCTQKSVD